MKDTKIIIAATILVVTQFIGLVMISGKKLREEHEYKKEKDSLGSEIFTREIQIQRYEYVIENLDSTCKEHVESLLSETE